MILNLRPYLAIALSLMLIFTSHAMAVARGLSGPDGQMVICTGQGPVMMPVDATGNPVGAPHICPDAALSLIQTAMAMPDIAPRPPEASQRAVPTYISQASAISTTTPHARGPPEAA